MLSNISILCHLFQFSETLVMLILLYTLDFIDVIHSFGATEQTKFKRNEIQQKLLIAVCTVYNI